MYRSTSRDGLWVHLYDANELDWRLADGTGLRVTQATAYPWQGEVALTVAPVHPAEFTLYLRIPTWAEGAGVTSNGQATGIPVTPGRYLALRRVWQPGDRVELRLPLSPVAMACHPRAAENRGSVAVQRGPLVYCLEAVDRQSALDWTACNCTIDKPVFPQYTGRAYDVIGQVQSPMAL